MQYVKTELFSLDNFLMSIPIAVFAMASDHTLLDFSKEVHSRKKGVLYSSCLTVYFFLFFTYLYFGFLHYFHFGQEIVIFNYGNIMRSYEFGPMVLLLCNFLIVLYVSIDLVMIFKPAKQLLTQLLGKKHLGLWSICSVLIIDGTQFFLSCLMIRQGTSIYLQFILVGIINMVIYNVIPMLIYREIFYFDRSKSRRIQLNYVLIFLSLFFIYSSLMNLFYLHLLENK